MLLEKLSHNHKHEVIYKVKAIFLRESIIYDFLAVIQTNIAITAPVCNHPTAQLLCFEERWELLFSFHVPVGFDQLSTHYENAMLCGLNHDLQWHQKKWSTQYECGNHYVTRIIFNTLRY